MTSISSAGKKPPPSVPLPLPPPPPPPPSASLRLNGSVEAVKASTELIAAKQSSSYIRKDKGKVQSYPGQNRLQGIIDEIKISYIRGGK